MTTQTQRQPVASPKPRRRSNPWIGRVALIAVSVIILSNLAAALLVAGFQIYYDGMIFPGVNVWGVDLGGMTHEEASSVLSGRFDYPDSAVITFRDGSNVWPITAGELGVHFDVSRTVQAAYEIGRQPDLVPSLRQQVAAWRDGYAIAPVIVYDQRAADMYMDQIASAINRPMLDATIMVTNMEVKTTPGQTGRLVDRPATLEQLRGMILSLESGEVEIIITEQPPTIESAEDAAVAVTHLLAEDFEVYIENPLAGDPGPWIAARESLVGMLVIERVDNGDGTATYVPHLNDEMLSGFLNPLAEQLERIPSDAKLIFNDETGQIEPLEASQDGRSLNIEQSVAAINEKAFSVEHRASLVFDLITPDVPDSASAEELGITEMIASATTYFAGSSQERRANVRTAASRFNGVVIPPGGEFSFNEHLGDVSVETGFEQALIIYNGRTIEGVGGGVCQVSTTAFQAAFYGGFPINERWPHGYWVGYYDSGEGKGMDATVFSPYVDFRFTNDTGSYLLIETETNLTRLTVTFRFYGTGDGRTVQKDGPYVTNVVPHGPTLYEEKVGLSPGTRKQVDYAVDGFDATVYRTVYRNGSILYQDTFFSQYVPWQAIFQVPPGEIPPGGQRVDSQ